MTEYEKAEAGLLYDAHSDKEVDQGRRRSQALSYEYNQLAPWQLEERDRMLRENLGHVGKNCVIEQPFHCDFWERVSVGDNFLPIIILSFLPAIKLQSEIMSGSHRTAACTQPDIRLIRNCVCRVWNMPGPSILETMSGSAAV